MVKGFPNLYAMEVDPNAGFNELPEEYFEGENREAWRMSRGVIQVHTHSMVSRNLMNIKKKWKIKSQH